MDKITCPNCGKKIEITQALKLEIKEEVLVEEKTKHKEELLRLQKEIEEKTEKKVKEEFEIKLKSTESESSKQKDKIEKLMNDLLSTNEQMLSLKQKDKEREFEMKKKLFEEREKMEEEISKTERGKTTLEVLEIKKQLEDTKKALEDAQRKAAQKSQQLQGEILELELEKMLRSAFPQDEIEPVKKGIIGADIKHIVKSPKGATCGVILWESKRTKDWSDKWIEKLKDDLRQEKANIPVIVSLSLPKEAQEGFGQKDGVFICSQSLVLPIASILRKNLMDVTYQKLVQIHSEKKADQVLTYVVSDEFKQQVEVIVEVYKGITEQITKERMIFEKSWRQREAAAQRLLSSTASIVGKIQGKVGGSALSIKGLELLELENGD